jgi:hypothetical protein
LAAAVVPVLLLATLSAAQTHPAPAAKPASPHAAAQPAPAGEPLPPVPTDRDVASTQSQLIKLLRLSPTLTTVIARDPSLLANQEYVSRNNPQLAEFLAGHPEVSRNPDFYLFTHMNHEGGGPDEALERAVWPDVYRARPDRTAFEDFASNLPPLLAFAVFLVAFIWAMRLILENRRWSRIFKLQSEVHGRLIEKFSTNQELAGYMETEAGKRFLEAAPIPISFGAEQRVPNAVARVLTPLQIGVVLVLLGIGFLMLRHAGHEMEIPMRVLGVVILMPGLGFIISAGLTWGLASRLGLMPPTAFNGPYAPPTRNDVSTAPFNSSERL